jgi:hypothetical protein
MQMPRVASHRLGNLLRRGLLVKLPAKRLADSHQGLREAVKRPLLEPQVPA